MSPQPNKFFQGCAIAIGLSLIMWAVLFVVLAFVWEIIT